MRVPHLNLVSYYTGCNKHLSLIKINKIKKSIFCSLFKTKLLFNIYGIIKKTQNIMNSKYN